LHKGIQISYLNFLLGECAMFEKKCSDGSCVSSTDLCRK